MNMAARSKGWRMVIVEGHKGVWWSAAVLIAALIVFAALGVTYVSGQIDANNRKWCATLVLLNSADQKNPPQGTYGQQLAADFQSLRESFGCSP